MDAVKRDPELVKLIQDLYKQQYKEKREFFESHAAAFLEASEGAMLEKRATTNYNLHSLHDFLRVNIAGLNESSIPTLTS